MARERFLINPPRRRRKSVRKSVSRNAFTGHPGVHKVASIKGWNKRRRKVRGYAKTTLNSPARISGIRRVSLLTAKRKYRRVNPFGEEVLIMGANPKRRKRVHHRRRRANIAMNPKRRVRRHRRRRNNYAMNPIRRHKRYARRRHNPIRRHYRRHRRNPAEISISRPSTLLMPMVIGLGAIYANQKVPEMLNMTSGVSKYGVMLATALGGAYAIDKAMKSREMANVWIVASLAMIGWEALNEYVLGTPLSGFGILPYGYGHTSALGYGGVPEELAVSGYGAVPAALTHSY